MVRYRATVVINRCDVCQSPFESLRSSAKYCSRACKDLMKYEAKDCIGCGTRFRTDHKETVYCNKGCSKRKPFRVVGIKKPKQCSECGMWMIGSIKVCSDGCRDSRDARRKANWPTHNAIKHRRNNAKAKECAWCSVSFTPLHSGNKYCSSQCKNNSSGGGHGARAKRCGVEREHVNKLKVFERDQWICQTCGISCDRTHSNNDTSPELDHIIPLSKGGGHKYDNVQLLCRSCNGAKGDSVEALGGQIATA